MPELRLLFELLDKITLEGNDEIKARVAECKQLLDKIGKTTVPVHIEIDYDGRQFRWRVHQNNMTAREYIARQRQ